ncbi:Stress responsive alpha-beta barrel [Sphingobium sp. C100]|uniref:Dabb family protein n=1 Tax=Sphingobium sp. C100 TaxID=1207055 RepID=UPI0003D5AFE6|nr:Dabb family protein [Sphingobium sp. C100]ETI65273.1 Stress responsive alpha-beta barrel [Sphingobium sp. C100]
MKTSRRELAAMMAAGVGAATLSSGHAATPQGQPMLVHHVFFWLKQAGSPADRDRLVAGLRTLAAIPMVRQLHVGLPAPTEQRDVIDNSYDVSELIYFDNIADQKAYQDHPIHRAFVASCEPLWRKVLVYDMAILTPA